MSKKSIKSILFILFILAFFVTPLGHYGKIALNRLFSFSPKIISSEKRSNTIDYDWKLKDADWNYFNFTKSEGKIVFINLWASWKLPSHAELRSVQKLYDAYSDKMDFYIITNEERPPVEEFMEKNKYTFPVTYLIIGEKTPINPEEVPSSYLIDEKGDIVIYEDDIVNWNSGKTHKIFDGFLEN